MPWGQPPPWSSTAARYASGVGDSRGSVGRTKPEDLASKIRRSYVKTSIVAGLIFVALGTDMLLKLTQSERSATAVRDFFH